MTADAVRELRFRIDQAQRERVASDGDPLFPQPGRRPSVARTRKTQTTDAPKPASRSRRKAEQPAPAPEATVPTVEPAAAAPAEQAWDPAPLVDLLMKDVAKAVADAKRVDPKSGTYFRIMVEKRTLAYVNVSKKGLTLDLATPRDQVPDGIAVKDGPNGSLPVKYKLDPTVPDLGIREAVELVKIAARPKEAAAA